MLMQGVPQGTEPTSLGPCPRPEGRLASGLVEGSGAGLLGQLGCIQGQSVVQKLVLLRGLDHPPSAGRNTDGNHDCERGTMSERGQSACPLALVEFLIVLLGKS